MTHFIEPFQAERCEPQNADQIKACAYVETLFGTAPAAVRSQSNPCQDVCFVKVSGALGQSFEVIVVDGLLVGIPPKGRY
jgi:hypothetical protein